MADWGNGGWGGLISGLNNAVMSPMFQSGSAMVNAGAEGKNVGAGFLAGSDAASKSSANALALAKARREQEQIEAQNQYWQKFNPQDKMWQGLPSGLLNLAQGTRNPDLIGKAFTTKLDLETQMRQAVALGNIKAANEIKLKMMENDLELQQIPKRLEMLRTLRGQQGGGQSPANSGGVRSYNSQTGELE